MAAGWNGSGVFQRLYSWVADAAAGLDISSTRMDADTNLITTTGLGNCLTRDGQGVATANLPMAGYRHTGVGNGVDPTDYVAMGQLESPGSLHLYATGLNVTGVTAMTGNATVGGTLGVTGATTLTGALTPSGGIVGSVSGANPSAANVGNNRKSGNTGGGAVTVTITIAAPAVVSSTAHNLQGIAAVQFTTTGALPTGLTAGTTYYAVPNGPNQLFLATSVGNAAQASYITTTGSQSGTQSMYQSAIATSTVVNDIAAIVLDPGNWDVYGDGTVNTGGATVTVATFWISTTPTTNPGPPGFGQKTQWIGSSATVPVLAGMRLSVQTGIQLTVYLSGVITAGSTTAMGGSIVAVRGA